MFKISLKSTESAKRFKEKMRSSSRDLQNNLRTLLGQISWKVSTRAQTYYLTGVSLSVQTDRLRSSVKPSPVEYDGKIFSVSVGTNVSYGRFWEEGFTKASGKVFEPRPWLRPAFEDHMLELNHELARLGREMLEV